MINALKTFKNYFSLVKFSHTVFAMPFALIGFTLAVTTTDYTFSLRLLILVVLCMVFARNAAMGFNRVADWKFDALNPRTSRREIPSGIINPKAAVTFVILNCILFIVSAAMINNLALYLSPLALIIVLGYSLTKRFTSLSHFVLGLGLSLAPTGAYISVTGKFDILPLLYSFIVLTWVSGFDIIYSLQDDDFDKKNRLYSIPALTSRKNAIIISIIVHAITFILLLVTGYVSDGGVLFWTGTLIFTSLLIYQHTLVKPADISRVDIAFGTTNGIASIVFAIFVIMDALTGF